jgi:hypothetical protein
MHDRPKETMMIRLSGALAAALTLAAGFAGTAKAETVYYYDDAPSLTYAPRVYTYSDPVIVAPAPRTYYYTAPTYYGPPPSYTYRSTTSYYYASPPGYVSTPYGYVPPGLSITVPAGTYAPLYGGWNSYSNENIGGYDGYRTTTDR